MSVDSARKSIRGRKLTFVRVRGSLFPYQASANCLHFLRSLPRNEGVSKKLEIVRPIKLEAAGAHTQC